MTRIKIKNNLIEKDAITSFSVKDYSILPKDIALNSFSGDIFLDGSIPASKLSDDVTKAGNIFNAPNKLVQLNNLGELSVNASIILSKTTLASAPLESTTKLFYNSIDNRVHIKSNEFDIILGIEVYNEVPNGAIDGTNTIFMLAHIPIQGTERIYVNGLREKLNYSYTINNGIITFSEPPRVGDQIVVDYKY